MTGHAPSRRPACWLPWCRRATMSLRSPSILFAADNGARNAFGFFRFLCGRLVVRTGLDARERRRPFRAIAITLVGLVAALSYCSWPVGYLVNPSLAATALASELDARGQPYSWLSSVWTAQPVSPRWSWCGSCGPKRSCRIRSSSESRSVLCALWRRHSNRCGDPRWLWNGGARRCSVTLSRLNAMTC